MKRAALLTTALALALAGSGLPAAAHGPRSHAPEGAFQVRLGGFFPAGGGELWGENEAVFSLDASDLDDFVLGFSYVHGINNNLELGFNLDVYDARARSQYRVDCLPDIDCVDEFGFPILHDTELTLAPLTVDLRLLPFGRHRVRGPGGRHVLKPVFYVGGGIGANFWEYEEVGDFLDFTPYPADPPEIFPARFRESGTAFEAHVLSGVELPVNPGFHLLFEGRYMWSDDTPSGDFAGLGRLEMDGFSAYAGMAFRF